MVLYRRLLLSVFVLALSSSVSGLAREKQRDWQTGKVVDSDRSTYFAGTVGNSNTTANANTIGNSGTYRSQTSGSQTAVYNTFQIFVIEGDRYAYLAQEQLRWRWSKAANLTVNGPVKYAVEKRKLFVIDEDGKEHQMEIIKKTLRVP